MFNKQIDETLLQRISILVHKGNNWKQPLLSQLQLKYCSTKLLNRTTIEVFETKKAANKLVQPEPIEDIFVPKAKIDLKVLHTRVPEITKCKYSVYVKSA